MISRRAARRLIVLHPKNIESELKWQTFLILCVQVHKNAPAQNVVHFSRTVFAETTIWNL
jgi:hypothetical protein